MSLIEDETGLSLPKACGVILMIEASVNLSLNKKLLFSVRTFYFWNCENSAAHCRKTSKLFTTTLYDSTHAQDYNNIVL